MLRNEAAYNLIAVEPESSHVVKVVMGEEIAKALAKIPTV